MFGLALRHMQACLFFGYFPYICPFFFLENTLPLSPTSNARITRMTSMPSMMSTGLCTPGWRPWLGDLSNWTRNENAFLLVPKSIRWVDVLLDGQAVREYLLPFLTQPTQPTHCSPNPVLPWTHSSPCLQEAKILDYNQMQWTCFTISLSTSVTCHVGYGVLRKVPDSTAEGEKLDLRIHINVWIRC